MTFLAGKLLSRLNVGSMLLADRGYDADWIRELAMKKGAWANIPPKSNGRNPICFSPYLWRARSQVERSSTRSNIAAGSPRAATGSRQYGRGYALTSPVRSVRSAATVLLSSSSRPSGTLAEEHEQRLLCGVHWKALELDGFRHDKAAPKADTDVRLQP